MHIGGQAIIEGIVMRSQEWVAAAVRLPNGKITVRSEKVTPAPWLFRQLFFRGMYTLVLMLVDGIRYLLWSANQQLGKEEQIQTKEIVFTLSLSVFFGLLFFLGLPYLVAELSLVDGVWFTLLEGVIRVGLFVGYLLVISRLPDVQRLFQYHGAEHKTIHCYEKGEPLEIHTIQRYSTVHPRCGTAFLFVVLIISVVAFSFLNGGVVQKVVGRLLFIPVIAGISYELLKLGDRFSQSLVVRTLLAPGLWLQKITTQEPDDQQVQVGIAALRKVTA